MFCVNLSRVPPICIYASTKLNADVIVLVFLRYGQYFVTLSHNASMLQQHWVQIRLLKFCYRFTTELENSQNLHNIMQRKQYSAMVDVILETPKYPSAY